MRILDERVERHLHDLRPERSKVMAEMQAVARHDSVPIVHCETGRFLATPCRALDRNALEVGTAIGYSTLHLAEQLASGRVSRSKSIRNALVRRAGYGTGTGVTDRSSWSRGMARESAP
jgi:hypothetical protein